MKKAIAIIIILLIIVISLASCKKDEPVVVSLESMKKALTEAGYTIEEDLSNPEYDLSTGGFIFVYPGAHGDAIIPVIEFIDKTAADAIAEVINGSSGGQAIVNDKFLAIYDSHGHNHGNEVTFLENLLNGKPLK